jgi:D-alanyl-lipoteichoic acid acyltransferase DltB (MBOAT superfamily)
VLFPTIDFAIFFAVVYTVQWILNPYPGPWKAFMVLASYFFYGWWDWRFIFLLAASTVIAQVGGAAIGRSSGTGRRLALWATLTGLIGLLLWFKYYGFFGLNLDNLFHSLGLGRPVPLLAITLPVGISFFTFMAISYVVDIHRGVLKPARPIDTAVYLSFFPHLVAGPIVRGTELLPQIRRQRDPRHVNYVEACWLITAGLAKKVVLSSYLATHVVDPVFADPRQHSALEVLVAVYGYAVQIYADFSGYTDIAIGLALLLGFQFPQNFRRPYAAVSLQDFWRRWHITLSFWLRDYLYIPLGGNRGREWRISFNILLTMVIGGLWHGAAWTFVAWGLFQGIGQVIGRQRRRYRAARGLPLEPATPGRLALARFTTFQLVCFGWLLFRADSLATVRVMLSRLFFGWGPSPLVTPLALAAIAAGIGSQYLPDDWLQRVKGQFAGRRPVVQGAILGLVLLAITTLGPQGVAPFIYYRF